MPSNRPVIAVRLEQQLYEKVVACAEQQGRSLSNFVEILVKKHMDKKNNKASVG